MNVSEILNRAADLIEPEGAWTQGTDCRDAAGNEIYYFDEEQGRVAVSFCAGEALYRVSGLPYNQSPGHQALVKLVGCVADWNDAPERTQAEVIAKLREAAKRADETTKAGNT